MVITKPHMDYYVFTTRQCNLSCSYCCFGDSVGQATVEEDPCLDATKTATFILDHIERSPGRDHKVFFYGGEPSLNERFIRELIELTEGKIRYVLQTNGTLLASLDPDILQKIHFLEISLDGGREANDARRGAGTYDKVVENLESIRHRYSGELVARMTYVPENPLADSVKLILDELRFDHVYWMHEDTVTPVDSWTATRERYGAELDKLLDYWLDRLGAGRPVSIIPFRSIVASLLSPPEPSPFRCGFGTYLRVVDIDGVVYPCDLMITGDKRYALGHIDSEVHDKRLPTNELYKERCSGCSDLPFCGGRCFNLSLRNDERFDEFCARTKLLIAKLEPAVATVRDLLERGTIAAENIHITTTLTEQIP